MPLDIGGVFSVRLRAEWGARFNYAGRKLMQLPASEVWLHHTVTPVTGNPDADARQVEQIGINRFGIPSYSFLIHPAGDIMQMMDDRQGAHTVADKPGWNPTNRNPISHGIAFVGDYSATRPTSWMTEAAGRLIWWLAHVRGHVNVGAPIRGHLDCKHTACLPLDSTEVLTSEGWIPLGDVTNEAVASWSPDSGVVSFAPAATVGPFVQNTVRVNSFEMTPDHDLVVGRKAALGCTCGEDGSPAHLRSHVREGRRRGEQHDTIREYRWKKMRADEAYIGSRIPEFVAADRPGLPWTLNQVRLAVWFQGDGHIMNDPTMSVPMGVEWHFAKTRKIERLSGLLDEMGIPFTRSDKSDGTVSLRVWGETAREQIIGLLPEKRFHWGLLDLSPSQADVFLDELLLVDGCAAGLDYSSSQPENLDVVQAVSVLNGRAARIDWANRRLYFRRGSKLRTLMRVEPARAATEVGCLTTVNGTLIVRQGGRVLVVGNCPGDMVYNRLDTIRHHAATPPRRDDKMRIVYPPGSGAQYLLIGDHLVALANMTEVQELIAAGAEPSKQVGSAAWAAIRRATRDPDAAEEARLNEMNLRLIDLQNRSASDVDALAEGIASRLAGTVDADIDPEVVKQAVKDALNEGVQD